MRRPAILTQLPELLATALGGLAARKMRTALIMLGPVLGVSAIVGAVGLSESAKGDLRAALRELGTNLVVVEASSTFSGEARFPEDVLDRVHRVDTVESVTAYTELAGVQVTPAEASREHFLALPVSVRAVDAELPSVLEVDVTSGRWINQFDIDAGTRSAVLGADLAAEYEVLGGEIRSIDVGGRDYGVVGTLAPVPLVPALDSTVFITTTAAVDDFGDDGTSSGLFVRSVEGSTSVTAAVLPEAISLGGADGATTSVPSSLLEAEAQVDQTLQAVVLAMGGLALVVGGVGIANVMWISVIQRSGEIGIRRALGHSRGIIAAQFLLEAFAIGALGGLAGAGVGAAVVTVGANQRGWIVTLDPGLLAGAGALAVLVSLIAGIFPAMKAARLEPLETLRLG